MTDLPKLKPCQFCGGGADLFEIVGLNTGHNVQCESCGAGISGPYTETEAVEAWNLRADLLPTREELVILLREHGLIVDAVKVADAILKRIGGGE